MGEIIKRYEDIIFHENNEKYKNLECFVNYVFEFYIKACERVMKYNKSLKELELYLEKLTYIINKYPKVIKEDGYIRIASVFLLGTNNIIISRMFFIRALKEASIKNNKKAMQASILRLAASYLMLKDIDKAKEYYESLLKKDFESTLEPKEKFNCIINLSVIYLKKKMYCEFYDVVKLLEQCYGSVKADNSLYFSYAINQFKGQIYFRGKNRDLKKALEHLKKAELYLKKLQNLKAYNINMQILMLTKGKVEAKLKKYNDAIKSFNKVIEFNIVNNITIYAYKNLYKLYEEKNEYENAIFFIKKYKTELDKFNKKQSEDYLTCFNIEYGINVVNERLECLNSLHKQLNEKNYIDSLTQCSNRRYLKEIIKLNFEGQRLEYNSFFIIDIDYFKKYNDNYGHLNGDLVIQKVAKELNLFKRTKEQGECIRYGGEEFLMLNFCSSLNEALKFGEKILNLIRNLNIRNSYSIYENITVSIGVYFNKDENILSSYKECILKADNALYRAKKLGRNRVESC